MSSLRLLNPDEFEDLDLISPVLEKFPKYLPDRPREKKSYLSTLIRNNKVRILMFLVALLTMVDGTVAAALFIGGGSGMQRVGEDQVAISALYSLTSTIVPTPLQSTVTQTTMVTQTSVRTDQTTVLLSQLRSTVYTTATAPLAPAITCQARDTGVTCGSLASRPE